MRRAVAFGLFLWLLLSSLGVGAAESPPDVSYTHISTEEKVVALTFDDGPHPRYTDEILDLLAEYGAKATFFVIGKNLELYGEASERAVREGHEIGNHTYSHPGLSGITAPELEREILMNEALIEEKTGKLPACFRPPEGYCTKDVRRTAAAVGCPLILWSIDTRDWSGIGSEQIVAKVMKEVSPGAIILFHDYIAKNSPTPAALKKILPRLSEAGYRFVTVTELLSAGKAASEEVGH